MIDFRPRFTCVLNTGLYLCIILVLSQSIKVCAQSSIISWGLNSRGQLGNATQTSSAYPVAVLTEAPAALASHASIRLIACGAFHSLALAETGEMYAWGDNDNGQLGDNSSSSRLYPVLVYSVSGVGGLLGKSVRSITAGYSDSAAITSDGALYCWGNNTYGQLGNGTTISSQIPWPSIMPPGKAFSKVAAGSSHMVALSTDGYVYSWGLNVSGQLGTGSTASSYVPVALANAGVIETKHVTDIASGSNHALAVLNDGSVVSWGYNGDGELGDTTRNNQVNPVRVFGLTGIQAVAAGSNFSLALSSTGIVYAWGSDDSGQLGDNSTDAKSIPHSVDALSGKVIVSIACGLTSSYALTDQGVLYAWGEGTQNQLGIGSATSCLTPVAVSITREVSALAGLHVLALGTGSTSTHMLVTAGIPNPVITSLNVDRSTLILGGAALITPSFTGGTALLTSISGSVTSSVPYSVSPTVTSDYTLTVTNTLGVSVTAVVHITVIPTPLPNLSFTQPGLAQIAVGASYTNPVTSTLQGGSYGQISYSSSDTAIATVNTLGVVTAVGLGRVTLHAIQTAVTGFNLSAEASYSLTVIALPIVLPSKIQAGITILNTTQSYSGKPIQVAVVLSPVQLNAAVVYYPGFTAPVEAGTYYVLVNIVDNNYYGSVSSILTILPVPQEVELASVENLRVGIPVSLRGTSTCLGALSYILLSGNASLAGSTLLANDSNPVVVEVSSHGSNDYLPCAKRYTLIASPYTAPSSLMPPSIRYIHPGDAVNLDVSAIGTDLTYQWYLNGLALTGSTAQQLTLASFSAAAAGSYTCTLSNRVGVFTSSSQVLNVNTTRLVNLSARASAGHGDFLAGFVTQGKQLKSLLVRGDGPSLVQFGVSNVLQNPCLSIKSQTGQIMCSNSGWESASLLNALFQQVGAFSLPLNSIDAALTAPFQSGAYSVSLRSVSNLGGQAMLEIYDVDLGTTDSELINLSARAAGVSEASPLLAGFVISGNTKETVLIRAVGPALSHYGVADSLAQLNLKLFASDGSLLASNQGWGSSASLVDLFNCVGAFALPSNSADCALRITLSPGAYTVQVSGINNLSGTTLVEIYKVSSP